MIEIDLIKFTSSTNPIFSVLSTLFSAIVGGVFSLMGARYIFSKENEKVLINRRHEIALNQLIPDLYNPLLNILNEYRAKEKIGASEHLDTMQILEMLDNNISWLLFVPDDIMQSIDEIQRICLINDNQKICFTTQDKLIVEQLDNIKTSLKKQFEKYKLRS